MNRGAAGILLALLCAAGPCLGAGAEASSGAPTRRFALVIGENKGGDGNVRLRYATSDARSFAELLTELGGVRPEDLVLLLDQSLASFKEATERLRSQSAQAGAAGQRCELVLYYSGHSDEEGLLFDKEKLPYAELRADIERVPAAVRVAILDSCSSGALTRAKGGSARPAFLFDASSDMEGHAYITSSSAAEAAQESDRIGGSFFTHHLVSALRGAADLRGQGKVTLNEAYAYAFRETLASTENTQYGPQHPAYEISLTGSGDLVFTDLRSSRAGILLSDELSGSIYVRDAKGNLAVELAKEAGNRMEVGLPQGKYAVSMIDGESRRQADVVVPASGRAYLSAGDFRAQTAAEKATSRGLAVTGASEGARDGEDRLVYRTSVAGAPFSFDAKLKPDLSQGIFSSDQDAGVAISALWGQARDVKVQVATLANADSGNLNGVQLSLFANAVQGYSRGVQAATFANFALGGFGGVQSSSLANIAREDSTGVQLGLVNVASRIKGTQVGLVNVSDSVVGAPIGLINAAKRMGGVPIGLVNVAEHIDGLPIGLVNIEKGGILSVQCWGLGLSRIDAGLAFGTRRIYTLVQGGYGRSGGETVPSAGLGLGGRLALGRFYGDLDLSWCSYFDNRGPSSADSGRGSPSARLSLRVLGGFPSEGSGLFAGLGLEGLMPTLSRDDRGDEIRSFTVSPTFILGLKLDRSIRAP
jgi:hypothetical protein